VVRDRNDPSEATLCPEDLRALARKYQRLVAWRGQRDEGSSATRDELRALAAEFPGCLRELDTLGPAELIRRASACLASADGDEPVASWMLWIDGYHALMKQALATRSGRARGEARAADSTFEQAVLSPPGGRMGVVVLRELAVRFGVSPAMIAATLFPPRRPSPYDL
jgi:hypothetical protein